MFDAHQTTHLSTFAARPTPLDALRAFVSEHSDVLLNAADLLGGTGGARRAQAALNGLVAEGDPTRGTLRACDQLPDLLMLEHVHQP